MTTLAPSQSAQHNIDLVTMHQEQRNSDLKQIEQLKDLHASQQASNLKIIEKYKDMLQNSRQNLEETTAQLKLEID